MPFPCTPTRSNKKCVLTVYVPKVAAALGSKYGDGVFMVISVVLCGLWMQKVALLDEDICVVKAWCQWLQAVMENC
jgi:hypothetical protein